MKKKEREAKYKLTKDSNIIEANKSVKILGITLTTAYNLINIDGNFCSKAEMQLNVLGPLQIYKAIHEKFAIVNGFIYANFNYSSLVNFLILVLFNRLEKLRKSNVVAWEQYVMIIKAIMMSC